MIHKNKILLKNSLYMFIIYNIISYNYWEVKKYILKGIKL